MWYHKPGPLATEVEAMLNKLAFEAAGDLFRCRSEISWEMCEALWARHDDLSQL